MAYSPNNYKNFLLFLTNHRQPYNAFELLSDSSSEIPKSYYNPYGFSEDLYPFEMQCPICLSNITLTFRPDKCYHLFCKPCLEHWSQESKKCPY